MDNFNMYTVLQISDSAFPTGGFSHSMGAESAVQHGQMKNIDDLRTFILSCIENTGSSCLPFVKASHENFGNLERIKQLDSLMDASLLNHVAHRASKQQGKSFLTTTNQVYSSLAISQLKELVESEIIQGHLAIVFAIVCASLNIPALQTAELFLFTSLRTAIASLVRLGKIGAVQAQKYQFEFQQLLDDVIRRNWKILPEDSCMSFPLTETIQNIHDSLFTKLFYS